MSVHSGPPCSRSSTGQSDRDNDGANDGPPLTILEPKSALCSDRDNPSTAQVIILSSQEELHTAPPMPPPQQRKVRWVCQVGHGGRMDACAWPTATAAAIAATGQQHTWQANTAASLASSSDAFDTESTISSHEGSFYASLRIEQNIHHQQHRMQRQQRQRLRKSTATTSSPAAAAASPTFALTGASDQTSRSSLQADILHFGFTPSSASPTATENTAYGWSASTDQTLSSPFTPFSPTGVYTTYSQREQQHHQQQQQLHRHLQQQAIPAYRALRPSRLVSTTEGETSLPAGVSTHSSTLQDGRMSVKSASSSCPRTPHDFMAWRRNLMESRTSASAAAAAEEGKWRGGLGPLHWDGNGGPSNSCSSRGTPRSCSSSGSNPTAHPRAAFVAPPALVSSTKAALPRSPLSVSLSQQHQQQQKLQLPHRHHHRAPPSHHAGVFNPSGPFVQSALLSTDFTRQHRSPRCPPSPRMGASTTSQRSRASSLSAQRSAVDRGSSEADYTLFDGVTRRLERRGAASAAASPAVASPLLMVRRDRGGYNRFEQLAAAALACVVTWYILNKFLFIDITLPFQLW